MKRTTSIIFTLLLLDSARAATFTVINTNLTGAGSLREAISNVNATAGAPHTIDFNIPGPGFTITPTNAFPTITNSVVIDGYTQPGTSSNTLANADNAVLLIELNGTNAGTTAGITLSGGNSTVRGLVINRFLSGGGLAGVRLLTKGNDLIEGNFIGTDPTGKIDLGNTGDGVTIASGGTNTIGGTLPGSRNIISGNGGVGVTIDSVGNTIRGNFIGVDATGTNALGNANIGVLTGVSTASSNTIAGNVISGNSSGISINSAGNLIEGNLIGTDATGSKALKNVSGGVTVASSNNVVGGVTVAARNIISGNGGIGVSLSGKMNFVQGNFIGTDITGTVALSNATFGVSFAGASNTVGGVTATTGTPPGNVISGNGSFAGITLNAVQGNVIQGNLIGTDATGTSALGNTGTGILVQNGSAGTVIADNVISANSSEGVNITAALGFKSDGCIVQGNWIGTDLTGTLDLGNGSHGVHLTTGGSPSADNITIGGAAGNVIAFNHGVGVFIQFGTNDLISANSIFSNTGLGIALSATSVTNNDACDVDNGANHFQNFPILTLATNTAGGLRIDGSLNSTALTPFRLEFFRNSACDPSGFGEGEEFIGFTNITTDAGCTANFSVTFTNSIAICDVITATATDPNNNTSEFSPCEVVQGSPPTVVCTLTPALATNIVGVTHVVTNLVTKDGVPAAGTVVFTRITAGPNAGLNAIATNDNNGLIEFSYTSTTNGTDTITTTGRVCAVNFSCTATKVWIVGNSPATITCPVNITTNNTPNQCSRSVAFAPVVTGSPSPTVTCTTNGTIVTSPVTFPKGTTTVSCTASNVAGMMSCSFDVTVNDTQAPTINQCASNLTASANASCQAAVPVFTNAVTATDNCTASGALVTTQNPTVGTLVGLGSNTVTITVKDAVNNSSQCTALFIVKDTTPPDISQCATSLVASANASCQAAAPAFTNAVVATDNCTGSGALVKTQSPAVGTLLGLGTNTITITVKDAAGNSNTCTASFIVKDTTVPSIGPCPSNISTTVPPATTSAVVTFTTPAASDNCSTPTVVCNPPSGFSFPPGPTFVVCTATDAAGNSNICTFTVAVTQMGSNAPPVAVCTNRTIVVTSGCSTNLAALALDGGSFDPDGDPITRSLNPPGPYALGTTDVTLTVADNHGGTNTCQATVTVVDQMPPAITCHANIVTNLPAGVSNTVVTFSAPITSDNCGVASTDCVPPSGTTFDLGTNTVTCTATDTSGNTNNCSFTIIVRQTPPVPHDLAVTGIKAHKNINLNGAAPSLTKFVSVGIVNLSDHDETITNYNGFLTLVVESLGTNCPNAQAVVHPGPPNKSLPLTLKSKKKLTVRYDVTYNCANDPVKGAGHEDYRHIATVNHAAIDGNADTNPSNDTCPRAANGTDKGCAAVLTDVFIKQ